MAKNNGREAESAAEAVLLAARHGTADELREALGNLGEGESPDGWIDRYGQTALHWAANRMPDVVPELLRAGADPNIGNDDGETPTLEAALKGNAEAFRAMVDAGADVAPFDGDKGIADLLHRAADGGCFEIIRMCIEAGHSVGSKDGDGNEPLHLAAYRGRRDVAEFLISLGADPNARNNFGDTTLHLARDDASLVAFLMASGADHSLRSDGGATPLHVAAKADECEKMSFLLDAGADPGVRDSMGRTPMHFAAAAGSFEACAILAPRSDISSVDQEGKTPLHGASNNGRTRVCSLLLDAGADPFVEDSFGLTPGSVAYGAETKSLMLAAEEMAKLAAETKPAESSEQACQGRRKRI